VYFRNKAKDNSVKHEVNYDKKS